MNTIITKMFFFVPGTSGEYAGLIPSVVYVKKLGYRKLRCVLFPEDVAKCRSFNYVYKF